MYNTATAKRYVFKKTKLWSLKIDSIFKHAKNQIFASYIRFECRMQKIGF